MFMNEMIASPKYSVQKFYNFIVHDIWWQLPEQLSWYPTIVALTWKSGASKWNLQPCLPGGGGGGGGRFRNA